MTKVKQTCEQCGAEFSVPEYKVRRGDGRFCSRSCSSSYAASKKHQKSDQSGENNPNWKGGVSDTPYRYRKRQKEKHPQKIKARTKLRRAVKSGRIDKQPCEQCGSTENLEGHHEDYSQPLEVTWLCKSCHLELHNQ